MITDETHRGAPGLKVGMDGKDIARYSICRAITRIAEGKELDGLEREASDAAQKLSGRDVPPSGFSIPCDVLESRTLRPAETLQRLRLDAQTRGLLSGTATAGGFLVETSVDGNSMIELLRNKSVVVRLGARVLSGLQGHAALPISSGGATAYWLDETGTVTASDQSFKQLVLTPHRLAAHTEFSRQLLRQSSVDVETFIRSDIAESIATERDRVCLNGLGAAGEPLGILNTTGVNEVTFGAAPTWAKVVDFEKEIDSDNALTGSLGWVGTPVVRAKWKTVQKVTNQAVFLLENGRANGYVFEATKNIPSDKVIFGNWNDLIIAEWSGIDIVVDPYSNAKSNKIALTAQTHTDVGLRHPESFVRSTDSGAQ